MTAVIRKYLGYSATWVLTRVTLLLLLGYLHPGTQASYQDVNVFLNWATRIAETHQLPGEPAWQYPPFAALVFLLPLLVAGHYAVTFMAMVLIADLITTIAIVAVSRRNGTNAGIWMWLLAIPMLGTLPLLRFDVIPTCIAVVALSLPRSRWRDAVFGVIAGVGVAVKAWPMLVLASVSNRKSALVSGATAIVTVAVAVVGSMLLFGNGLGFLTSQGSRGLELEAVAATPWYVRQFLTGHGVQWAPRNGSLELTGGAADTTAAVLHVMMILAGLALVGWWFFWVRKQTEQDARRDTIGRDAAFTAVLGFIVLSPVLSPQYLVWLIGIGAVVMADRASAVRRPVVFVLVAVLITQALLACWGDLVTGGQNGAYLLSIRNGILLVAAVDAFVLTLRSSRVLSALSPASSTVSLPASV